MAGTAHPVGNHSRHLQFRTVPRQAAGHCGKSLGHARGVHHDCHRQAEAPGQVGAAGLTVIKAHRSLHQDQVRLIGGLSKLAPTVLLTHHPQVQRRHRRAAGNFQLQGVQVVGANFEHPHPPPRMPMGKGQGGGDQGLALPGSNGADEQRRGAIQGRFRSGRHLSAGNADLKTANVGNIRPKAGHGWKWAGT